MFKNRFALPVFISLLSGLLVFSFLIQSSFSLTRVFQLVQKDSLKLKYNAWHRNWPMERVFLQTDKPLYNPGETIWFSVFLVEESRLSRPSLSEIVYIEVLNPKGSIEKQFTLIARGGKANGDFELLPEAPGGVYKLKAYTKWMQNTGREVVREVQVQETVVPQMKLTLELDRQAYKSGDKLTANFEAISLDNQPFVGATLSLVIQAGSETLLQQTAQTDPEGKYRIDLVLPAVPIGTTPVLSVMATKDVQSESITKTIPMVEKDLLVYFFPEGGDFVLGQTSQVAFKVLKPDSTSADAEGWLVNQKGEKITYVRTFHKGMGSFELKAKPGEQYKIEWISPLAYTSALPDPLEKGYSLAVQQTTNDLVVRAGAPESDNLLIVAEMRGKWLWDKTLKSVKNPVDVRIPIKEWPAGVVKISLFDGRGLVRCERMSFVNPTKQLSISVKTDKEKYQTREKVTVNVRVSDDRGIPVPGLVSLAVVNDALLSYAADKQGNLVSSLLLEQDLQTKIEDPSFYFSKNAKATKALDLLLLTHGWRGLSWKKIQEEPLEKPGIGPEKAVIAGTLMNSMDNQPVVLGKLEIGKTVVYTDSNGSFRFPFIDLTKPVTVKISKGKERVDVQSISRYNDQLVLYYNQYPVVYERLMPMAANAAMDAVERNGIDKAENVQPVNKRVVVKALKGGQPKPPAGQANKERDMAKMQEPPQKPQANGAPPFFKRPARIAPPPPPVEESPYYLVRTFPNLPPPKTNERTDFKSTLFWSGIVDLDLNGRSRFSFFTADEISSYRATVQGIGPDGLLGTGGCLFYTELPFSVSTKIPVEASVGDQVVLPVRIDNKTSETKTFQFTARIGDEWAVSGKTESSVTLKPRESKEIPLSITALKQGDSSKVHLAVVSGQDMDQWEKTIRIIPRGFPVRQSFSGREQVKYFNAEIRNLVPGSLSVHATAFPDVTSDLLAGVESILQEPFGCFEQTSMTSYPNVLVLNYLKQSNSTNTALVSNAEVLLEKGYKRLTSFETKQKGYEWFGGTPAHEALTAYGLMQFKEMQKVAPYVDAGMIDRTAAWLLSRRDGKGGFLRSAQALDNFGRANDDITNAYIVYSLAEAGFQQLDLEVKKTTETALLKKDPYLLALAANTLWLLKQNDLARDLTNQLLKTQAPDGSFTGLTHSITYSTGQALSVETTGFSILALIRSEGLVDKARIDKAVQFLCNQRSGAGGFGNSQATIVALKALTAYVVFSKRAAEDGAFSLVVNDQQAVKTDWKAGTQKAISVGGWEKYLKEGQNKLEFSYSILKDPLPFTVGIDYFTSLPPSDPNCKLSLTTRLGSSKVALGKPVQMEIQLKNKSTEGLPMTMACVSVPAGCVVAPVQFKELVDARKVDFYEVKGNRIFLYYRQMAPSESRSVTLTLTPMIRGKYLSSASSAYLYYTAERKDWAEGLPLEIQ